MACIRAPGACLAPVWSEEGIRSLETAVKDGWESCYTGGYLTQLRHLQWSWADRVWLVVWMICSLIKRAYERGLFLWTPPILDQEWQRIVLVERALPSTKKPAKVLGTELEEREILLDLKVGLFSKLSSKFWKCIFLVQLYPKKRKKSKTKKQNQKPSRKGRVSSVLVREKESLFLHKESEQKSFSDPVETTFPAVLVE